MSTLYLSGTGRQFEQILYRQKVMTHTLRVQLVEEVDGRMSRSVTEIYVDK